MDAVLNWGLDFIRTIQTAASPALTLAARVITAAGGKAVFLALLPFLYWCVDEKKGFRLGAVILISAWINMLLKLLLDQPRPFFEGYDSSVGMTGAEMGGLPSGHAQNSLVLFFMIASFINKKWAYAFSAFFCFLIGFSRIYLGVHFPTDVLSGWILGIIILGVYFLFNQKIWPLLAKGGFRAGIIASAVVSFIMILYLPDKILIAPAGSFLGFGAGYLINSRYIGFSANAFILTGIKKYLVFFARLILGFSGFFLILIFLGKLIPRESGNVNLYLFVQASLAGFWVSAAAPWIFLKSRLDGAGRARDT